MKSTSLIDPPSRRASFLQEHALTSYFLLAFFISWAFWFIEPSLRSRDSITAGCLIQLGSYGPILAAMFVSFVSASKQNRPRPWPRFLAGGLALSAAIFSNWLPARNIFNSAWQPVHFVLLVLLTLLPGWIFFNTLSRSKGVQDLLNSLTRWRIHPLWFGVAMFLMAILGATGILLTSLITGKPLSSWVSSIGSNPTFLHLGPTFLATALYGGPLGEEAGWRGFALPRLQKRFDPLLASVYLGLIWGLWHLPLHLTGYYNALYGNPLMGVLSRLFTAIPQAVLFTWLYNRTNGNLLVVVIFHTAFNLTSALIAPEVGLYITVTIAVVLMVVFDRMYKKTRGVSDIRELPLRKEETEEKLEPRF